MISNHMQLDGILPTNQMSKKDFTAILPDEVSRKILSYLGLGGLIKFLQVNKRCHELANSENLWNGFILSSKITFSKKDWLKYGFENVSEEPSLPSNTLKIIQKLSKDKFLCHYKLIFVPENINGNSTNMKTLYDILLNKKPRIKSLIDDDYLLLTNLFYRTKIEQIIERSKSEQTPLNPIGYSWQKKQQLEAPSRLIS